MDLSTSGRSLTPIETAVKVRSGKKWKKRYCVLERSSPINSDFALLLVYKNVKCSLKSGRKSVTLRLEGFYGLECGFLLDKESTTLAIICQSSVVVLAFDSDYMQHSWKLWMRDFFGYSCQYSVLALELPASFASKRNSVFRLHLRDERFCLINDEHLNNSSPKRPTSPLVELSFKNLRRFGATPEKKFFLEAGTKEAGACAGVYIFRSSIDQRSKSRMKLDCCVDEMAWMFQLARDGRLNSFLARRRENSVATDEDYENFSVGNGGGAAASSSLDDSRRFFAAGHHDDGSTRSAGNDADRRWLDENIPKNPIYNQSQLPAASSSGHRRIVGGASEVQRDFVKPSRLSESCYGNLGDSKPFEDAVTIRHHRPRTVRTIRQPPPAYSSRPMAATTAGNYENRSVPDGGFKDFPGVVRRERPSSVCEQPGCSIGVSQTPSATPRPLSEIHPSSPPLAPAPPRPRDRLMLPYPVPPSACSRCRNYVNQPFIDSLQYYYNIDHVVLALSKKSKCCDHVCSSTTCAAAAAAAAAPTTMATTAPPSVPLVMTISSTVDGRRGVGEIDETARGLVEAIVRRGDEVIDNGRGVDGSERNQRIVDGQGKAAVVVENAMATSVIVPSTDYAAMAPCGGLYVLMEPSSMSPEVIRHIFETPKSPPSSKPSSSSNGSKPPSQVLIDSLSPPRIFTDSSRIVSSMSKSPSNHQQHGIVSSPSANPIATRRNSVPPDDPHSTTTTVPMGGDNVVVVESMESSKRVAANSGIMVKPFEPLVFGGDRRLLFSVGQRSVTETRGDSIRFGQSIHDQSRHSIGNTSSSKAADRSLPVNFPAGAPPSSSRKSSNSRAIRRGTRRGDFYQYASYRRQRSEEVGSKRPPSPSSVSNVLRSASFAARDVFRSSSRRTKTFFGDLAKRASSAVFPKSGGDHGGGGSNGTTTTDGGSTTTTLSGRESRAKSEPPRTPTTDPPRVTLATSDRHRHHRHRLSNDSSRKWQHQNSVDLDEVIYEGTCVENSSKVQPSMTAHHRSHHSQKMTNTRKLVLGPQRSVGTESTWSNDSNAFHSRESRRLVSQSTKSQLGAAVEIDSVSIMSEISDSDVFDQDSSSTNWTSNNQRNLAMLMSTQSEYVLPNSMVEENDDRSSTNRKRTSNKKDVPTFRNHPPMFRSSFFSGYDADGSSDSHAAWSTMEGEGGRNESSSQLQQQQQQRRRIEKRAAAAYSPPPAAFDRSISPMRAVKSQDEDDSKKKTATTPKSAASSSSSKRHMRALAPPFPPTIMSGGSISAKVEGEIFKFPPAPTFRIVDDSEDARSTTEGTLPLLNYATLAMQDESSMTPGLTPTDAQQNRLSIRRSFVLTPPPTSAVGINANPVLYAKIDELATHAARKLIVSRQQEEEESRTLQNFSDLEQNFLETASTSRSVPCHNHKNSRRSAFMLKKPLMRRRLSFASLSGV